MEGPMRALLGGGGAEAPYTFEELVALCATLFTIWIMGRVSMQVGLPGLVGQIAAGICLGPHALNIAPKPHALSLFGEFGLILMVLEAGLEVELDQLALVGAQGVKVAVVGSLLPLLIGFGLAKVCFNLSYSSALAVGASLAPTSMGISLKVLEEGKVLNTPTGQLIIAAAVIDDVIALILLSELQALKDPTPVNFIVPIVSSFAFIIVFGYVAVKIVPPFLKDYLVPRLPKAYIEPILLFLVLASGYGLMCACHYGESSHLLGVFLGGLSWCTLASLKHIWHKKVYDILQWLIKIFFACSIGFEVPIKDLWSPRVLLRTFVFLFAALGKLATGFFAQPFSLREGAKVGFAMSAWGEFAFIVATASREAGTLSDDDYAAVVFAVLLSAIYSPFAVKSAIDTHKAENAGNLKKMLAGMTSSLGRRSVGPMKRLMNRFRGNKNPTRKYSHTESSMSAGKMGKLKMHHVYYACSIRCKSTWGLQNNLFKGISTDCELDIIDFRIHTSGGFSLCELYLRDQQLLAPQEDVEGPHNEMIAERVEELQGKMCDLTGVSRDVEEGVSRPEDRVKGEVIVERWLPALDDDNPDDDDKEAYQQAELAFHGSYPEEARMKIAKTASTTNMAKMKRAGSLLAIKDALKNEADVALHNMMLEHTFDTHSTSRNDVYHAMEMRRERLRRLKSQKSRESSDSFRRLSMDNSALQNGSLADGSLTAGSGLSKSYSKDLLTRSLSSRDAPRHLDSSKRTLLDSPLSDHGANASRSKTFEERGDDEEEAKINLSSITVTGAAGKSLAREVKRQILGSKSTLSDLVEEADDD